jgi:hypothetical protein
MPTTTRGNGEFVSSAGNCACTGTRLLEGTLRSAPQRRQKISSAAHPARHLKQTISFLLAERFFLINFWLVSLEQTGSTAPTNLFCADMNARYPDFQAFLIFPERFIPFEDRRVDQEYI